MSLQSTWFGPWDEAHREFAIACEGLADEDLWTRPEPRLLSVGELAGHIAYWQAVHVFGGGDDARFGLMIRDGAEDHSPSVFVGLQASKESKTGRATFRLRPGAAPWGNTTRTMEPDSASAPGRLRLVSQGGYVGGFVSSDGQTWMQVGAGAFPTTATALGGLAALGGPAEGDSTARTRASLRLNPAPGLTLPILDIAVPKPRPARRGKGAKAADKPETRVTIVAAAGAEVFYTLDGSEPSRTAQKYSKPLSFGPGPRREMRARAWRGDQSSGLVVAVIPALEAGTAQSD